jgi:hypothetical protein
MSSKPTFARIDRTLKLVLGLSLLLVMVLSLNAILLLPVALIAWDLIQGFRRPELDDERTRHIVLMAGYLSRQLALLVIVGLLITSFAWLLEFRRWIWIWAPLLALTVPDAFFRRYFGLRSEDGAPVSVSVRRVTWAVWAGMMVGFAWLSCAVGRNIMGSLGWTWRDLVFVTEQAPPSSAPAPASSGVRLVPKTRVIRLAPEKP